jgi:CheY-like chemotaxis protein
VTPLPSNTCEILLVEDDPADVLLMEKAFRKAGSPCTLEVRRDGEEAVAFLAARAHAGPEARLPSLVITDLQMPRKSGHEVLEWIRHEPKLAGVPVVVLSASREQVDVDRAMALGAKACLQKPCGQPALIVLVKGLLDDWTDQSAGGEEAQSRSSAPGSN